MEALFKDHVGSIYYDDKLSYASHKQPRLNILSQDRKIGMVKIYNENSRKVKLMRTENTMIFEQNF